MLRRFQLRRKEDETGVSGEGVVALGCRFPSGRCVIEWVAGDASSVAIYDSMPDLESIHGHGGKTVVEWLDQPPRAKATINI